MSILHIIGAKGVGKTTTAQNFRGQAINMKRGALMVDENLKNDGATQHLLEKIIADAPVLELKGKLGRLSDAVGEPIAKSIPIDMINWKPDPMIIFVNDAIERLADFEAMVPGFTERFGPVRSMEITERL